MGKEKIVDAVRLLAPVKDIDVVRIMVIKKKFMDQVPKIEATDLFDSKKKWKVVGIDKEKLMLLRDMESGKLGTIWVDKYVNDCWDKERIVHKDKDGKWDHSARTEAFKRECKRINETYPQIFMD